MRRTISILLLSFSSTFCLGQTQPETQKITAFKNNYLRKANLNQPDTLKLDSLTIVREKYPDFRTIKTFRKNKDLVLQESYYNKTTQIKSTITYDSIGRPIGISKHYTRKGVLEYTQDYDKGKWTVYEKDKYPFYDLQVEMKVKADSLVSKMYGHDFLINHTVWSAGGSYIFNGKEQKKWISALKEKPSVFLFCYQVNLNKQKSYTSQIYFKLDSNGTFLPDYLEYGFFNPGYGFETVPENMKGSFRLNHAEAISKAKSLGLTETDSTKAFSRLYWESFRKPDIINGQFRFYVVIETKTTKELHPSGRTFRTTKYDVYSFSPWSGEFIEIKKMKINDWWEGDRRGFTDLQADRE